MNQANCTTNRFIAVAAALSVCLLVGCGEKGPPRFAVSGKVAFDGQPVESGTIGFVPAAQVAGKSTGADIVDGRYEVPDYQGLQAGTYNVIIYAEKPTGRKLQADEGSSERIDELVQFIPDTYNANTTLSVEVSGDRQDLDFMLEMPKPGTRRR